MSEKNSDSFEFDKFMDEIIVKEEVSKKRNDTEDDVTPQREYVKRYRELPQNRVKFGR